jgi:hypothetical protein
MRNEFDYLEDYNSDEDIDSINNGKIMFTYDEDAGSSTGLDADSKSRRSERHSDEVEEFFDNSSFMDYGILSCGTKILYKCESRNLLGSNKTDAMVPNPTVSQVLDSSSLFMIVLEAATFLDYTVSNPFVEDVFTSPTSSPSAVSIIDDLQVPSHVSADKRSSLTLSAYNALTNVESFKSVRSTPIALHFRTPIDEFKSPFPNDTSRTKFVDVDDEMKNIENQSLTTNDYKMSYCFLKNSNKSYNFYDVLFIKVSSNLCLTLLKLNDQSKYAELISDLDSNLNELLLILDHKSMILANAEADFKASELKQSDAGCDQTATDDKPAASPLSGTTDTTQKDEENEGKFISIFINKLITFYEKLQVLKNELNTRLVLNNKIKTDYRKNSSETLVSQHKKSSDSQSLSYLTTKIKSKMSKSDSSVFDKKRSFRVLPKVQVELIQNQLKLINTIQVKINQLVGNKQFMNCFNLKTLVGYSSSSDLLKAFGQLLVTYRNIKTQVELIKSNLKDLLFELFLRKKTYKKPVVKSERFFRTSSDSTTSEGKKSDLVQFNSANLMNVIKTLLKTTNFYLYMSYIDVKLKCNVAMSFYNLNGLIHFSFINRNENLILIPTIDLLANANITELNVHVAYRKYYPLVLTLLYKYDCTKVQFVDKDLGVVFNYSIWFEDKNSNMIPLDFSMSRRNQYSFESQQSQQQQQQHSYLNAYFNADKKASCPPGITSKSYYDLLRKTCYPNAADSIVCFELVCIHSIKLDEQKIKEQFFGLASILSQMRKKRNT